MRTLSTIFSWAGTALDTIFGFIILEVYKMNLWYYAKYYFYYIGNMNDFAILIRVVFWSFTVLSFIVLIIREISLSKGHKVVVGILTIIFASQLGGMFTLLIPEEQLQKEENNFYNPYNIEKLAKAKTDADSFASTVSEKDVSDLLFAYRKMLEDGVITIDQYEAKKREVLGKK